ncbi:MAG: hypothetical protein ACYST0_03870 [Planctomycetota bacterium]|jgi:flagellar motor switch protein FliM
MKELLSNKEIDTLLEMFRSEDPPPASAIREAIDEQDEAAISPVDLLRPNLLTAEQMRGLERLFDGSAKLLAAVMSDKLGAGGEHPGALQLDHGTTLRCR